MTELLESLRLLIENVILTLGYPGLALIIFVENLVTPVPSEIVLPFAGSLISRGLMTFTGVLFSTTLGAVLGALVLYYIGMWADDVIIRRFARRYGRYVGMSEPELDRALNFFSRYGEVAIFFARVVPLVRSLISVPAGMQRMGLLRFILLTALGSLLWNALLAYAGFQLGENWEEILVVLDRYEQVMMILLAIAAVAYVVWRWRKRREKAAAGKPEQMTDA